MSSSVATAALPPIKIQELNPYFERFEREREGNDKNLKDRALLSNCGSINK